MNHQEEAKKLVDKYFKLIDQNTTAPFEVKMDVAEACAIIAVQMIINANPHSNPFNTGVYSTMGDWIEVKECLINQ